MSYNETITLINYAKDLDIEYNLKLFLLTTVFIYSIAALIISYKWQSDQYFVKLIKNLLLKLPSTIIIFFFPLFSIYLFREVSWEVFYTFMIAFYSYSLIVLMLSLKVGLFEYGMDLLQIKPKTKEIRL